MIAFHAGVEFAVRKTSHDRFWTGFDAAIYDTSGGYAEALRFANHRVCMHIGPPITATCRYEREVHRRLQVPGDIALIAAGHSSAWINDGPTTLLIVNVAPSLMRSAALKMDLDVDGSSISPHLHLQDPQLAHIGWALKAELESDRPVGRLYADSLGLALAAHLLRRYRLAVPCRPDNGFSKRRLERVYDYIHDHPARDLTIAELAGIANVSPSHFKLLFKQSTGVPVHKYVMRSRVEYARMLLMRGNSALADVASQAGFTDQSHMCRCMRRVSGVSPQALSRQVRSS